MRSKIPAVLGAFLAAVVFSSFASSSADSGQMTAAEVVDKVNERILSAPEMVSWRASARSTLIEMDKSWQPKKKTVIERTTVVEKMKRREEVLSATEYEDGEVRDVTSRFRAEAEALNRKTAAGGGQEARRTSGGHRGLDLTRDELFPFREERRKDFDFIFRTDVRTGPGETVILESRSRIKSSDRFEGTYVIDPATFDVLSAELRPAKVPVPLRELEMRVDFVRLPRGHIAIAAAKARIHVGLIVKQIRMQSEDVFFGYEIRE